MKNQPTVTTAQALETYKRTVKDEPNRINWPQWIVAVSNSLAAGAWIGADNYPAYAKEVFEAVKAENKVSYSDSK